MPEVQSAGLGLEPAHTGRRGTLVKIGAGALWLAVLVFALGSVLRSPSVVNWLVFGALVLLCLAINAQALLQRAVRRKRFDQMTARLTTSTYISDAVHLPNRNYLLAEIRREIARSRSHGVPFSLVHLSLAGFGQVRSRRGDEFAERALQAMVVTLRRITRSTDFLGYIDDSAFAIVLAECDQKGARAFLRRVPGTLPVSDGQQMLEIPIAARLLEYDLETVYATDLLRDTERSTPLSRENVKDITNAA